RKPNCVLAFAEDTAGAIWIGGGGLRRMRNGIITSFDSLRTSVSGDVMSLLGDRDGTMWIGGIKGLFSWDGSHFQAHPGDGRTVVPHIRTIVQSRDGSLWLGSERGLLHYTKGAFRRFTTADGLPHDFVRGIYEDAAGDVWIATYGGGLARLRAGKFD